jgi:SH3 domain-containing YSC84-like protein 1
MRTALLAYAAAIALLLTSGFSWAKGIDDETALIDNAVATVHHMRHDETFGPSRDLLHRARAVLIVPGLVKGGFFFGGEGGNGVFLERHGDEWSDPAFYTLASGSFGLQIGLEKAQLVMFVMSERALRSLERSKFKFGGNAGLTVVTVGANAQGASAPNLSGDIIVWSSTVGAYGGLTLEGSVVEPKRGWNDDFYGQAAGLHEIFSGRVHNDADRPLREALADLDEGRHAMRSEGMHHDEAPSDRAEGPPRSTTPH